jgi:hypothetical protein
MGGVRAAAAKAWPGPAGRALTEATAAAAAAAVARAGAGDAARGRQASAKVVELSVTAVALEPGGAQPSAGASVSPGRRGANGGRFRLE